MSKNSEKILFLLWGDAEQLSGATVFTHRLNQQLRLLGHTSDILYIHPTKNIDTNALQANTQFEYIKKLISFEKGTVFIICDDQFVLHFLISSVLKINCTQLQIIGVLHAASKKDLFCASHIIDVVDKLLIIGNESFQNTLSHLGEKYKDKLILQNLGVPIPKYKKRHSKPIILTYAGRLEEQQKKVLRLIPIVAELENQNVHYELHIAGDGSYHEALKRDLQNVSKAGRVHFLGNVPYEKMSTIWEKAHIFISVSDYEGQYLALQEAMSYGCVPLVPDVVGIRELIKNNVTGLLVSPQEPRMIAKVLDELSCDSIKYERMSNDAAKYIQANHSIELACEELLAATQSVKKTEGVTPMKNFLLGAVKIICYYASRSFRAKASH